MSYKIFDPKVNRPLHEVSSGDAREAYNWFIENIPERLKEISDLLNSDNINLDLSDNSLVELHDWFIEIVQEERSYGNASPSPELFSVCNDIAIYIAEMIRKEGQNIDWNFYTTNSKGLSYQRPVLIGFNVKNKDFHIDIDILICQYAFRILKTNKIEEDRFLKIFEKAKTIL
ncbi:MAG: hypothetical protein OEY96_12280 [Gammaproteobacteria bacterium]|nr:hypothetical protein [Gammaproteobacteria bacterium]